ncbi:DUF4158 domain-containing protein [Micromonospora fulviviridis]|uniref:DUF4158 domain-containing protein n=1 Tax=Micromonospora fulviviridis TaxID=47860 RepID=A0ABV2VTP6_9ACTN
MATKRGATRLGFAVLLKFYGRYGRFPRGRAEVKQDAVEFVAAQVKMPAADFGYPARSSAGILDEVAGSLNIRAPASAVSPASSSRWGLPLGALLVGGHPRVDGGRGRSVRNLARSLVW